MFISQPPFSGGETALVLLPLHHRKRAGLVHIHLVCQLLNSGQEALERQGNFIYIALKKGLLTPPKRSLAVPCLSCRTSSVPAASPDLQTFWKTPHTLVIICLHCCPPANVSFPSSPVETRYKICKLPKAVCMHCMHFFFSMLPPCPFKHALENVCKFVC